MSPLMLICLICLILTSCVYCGKKNNEDIIVINNGGGGGCGGGARTIVKTAGGKKNKDKKGHKIILSSSGGKCSKGSKVVKHIPVFVNDHKDPWGHKRMDNKLAQAGSSYSSIAYPAYMSSYPIYTPSHQQITSQFIPMSLYNLYPTYK